MNKQYSENQYEQSSKATIEVSHVREPCARISKVFGRNQKVPLCLKFALCKKKLSLEFK